MLLRGEEALSAVCPISRLDVVVTGPGLPPGEREALSAAGVRVRQAG
ncbi:hypothetical protein [Nonomuraea sp. B1E8]